MVMIHKRYQVPSSSERMLKKSLTNNSDTLIYDLEDSVAPSEKDAARGALSTFLQVFIYMSDLIILKHGFRYQNSANDLPEPSRIAVRLNAVDTPFFQDDIVAVVSSIA